MSELKPCPFCGSAVTLQEEQGVIGFQCMIGTGCAKSGLVTAFDARDKDTAIPAWNRRADPPEEDATHKLIANLFELALEWKSRDCAFRDPDARYCELKEQAKALGYLDGSRL